MMGLWYQFKAGEHVLSNYHDKPPNNPQPRKQLTHPPSQPPNLPTTQTKCEELLLLEGESREHVREKTAMRSRISQFKQAITDILKQHTEVPCGGQFDDNNYLFFSLFLLLP